MVDRTHWSAVQAMYCKLTATIVYKCHSLMHNHMLTRVLLLHVWGFPSTWLPWVNRLDCWMIDSNKVESVNSKYIKLNMAHDRADSYASSRVFLTESILQTINRVEHCATLRSSTTSPKKRHAQMLCKVTHCAGGISDNARPHQLHWNDYEAAKLWTAHWQYTLYKNLSYLVALIPVLG